MDSAEISEMMPDSDQDILVTESPDQIIESGVIELREKLMAFLFVSTKPVSITELSNLTKSSSEEVELELESLRLEISELNFGLELKMIGDRYQLRTMPHLSKTLQRLITPKMKRLSKAAAETLAVVAYKQPVSRAEIEAIRGVDALPTLRTLLDGRLIRIVGREETPGSPALYGTTDFFLERFGLKDLSELPTIREVRELVDEQSEFNDTDEDIESDDENEKEYSELDLSIDDTNSTEIN